MVTAVVGGQEAVGMLRVADYGVEVDDCVKVTGGANPLIDCLTVGLAEWAGVVVVRPDVGRDGRSVDAESVRVGTCDDLLVRGENLLHECGVLSGSHLAVAG